MRSWLPRSRCTLASSGAACLPPPLRRRRAVRLLLAAAGGGAGAVAAAAGADGVLPPAGRLGGGDPRGGVARGRRAAAGAALGAAERLQLPCWRACHAQGCRLAAGCWGLAHACEAHAALMRAPFGAFFQDQRISHGMEWPSVAAFWDGMTRAGPWHRRGAMLLPWPLALPVMPAHGMRLPCASHARSTGRAPRPPPALATALLSGWKPALLCPAAAGAWRLGMSTWKS